MPEYVDEQGQVWQPGEFGQLERKYNDMAPVMGQPATDETGHKIAAYDGNEYSPSRLTVGGSPLYLRGPDMGLYDGDPSQYRTSSSGRGGREFVAVLILLGVMGLAFLALAAVGGFDDGGKRYGVWLPIFIIVYVVVGIRLNNWVNRG